MNSGLGPEFFRRYSQGQFALNGYWFHVRPSDRTGLAFSARGLKRGVMGAPFLCRLSGIALNIFFVF